MNFKDELNAAVREVEQAIYGYLPAEEGYQKTIFEAINYSMKAPGKRLRPLLMRETYRMFGGQGQEIEPFMAAIEMVHTSSLVHDDLPCMDNDELRRGIPTTWVQFGYDMAVLTGDALMIYSFETAAKALSVSSQPAVVGRCMGLLAEKSGIYGMIGGQTVDVERTGQVHSRETLDFIYRLKTGGLLEASMMIGALLGGANEEQVKKIEEMAADIGLAFQIQDDILDVTSSAEVLGKPVHSDEKNQKTTYVALEGIEKAKAEVTERSERVIACLHAFPQTTGFMEQLVRMLIHRSF